MVSSLVNTLSSNKNIQDNAAAPVKFIIVGADRVVKNGDTANKIGTFQLSTIANFFNSNKPVSYTHLDVYKRQIVYWLGNQQWN